MMMFLLACPMALLADDDPESAGLLKANGSVGGTMDFEHHIDWCTVGQEWHVFLTYHLADNTLVAVTTGHLIADANLTLLGDVNLS